MTLRVFSKYRRMIILVAAVAMVAMIAGPVLFSIAVSPIITEASQPTQLQGELRKISTSDLERMTAQGNDLFVYFRPRGCAEACEQADLLLSALSALVPNLYAIDANTSIMESKFQITDQPVLVHYQGGRETNRLVGGQDFQAYVSFLGLAR